METILGDGFHNGINVYNFTLTGFLVLLGIVSIGLAVKGNVIFGSNEDSFKPRAIFALVSIMILLVIKGGLTMDIEKRIETYDYFTNNDFKYYSSDALEFMEKDIEEYDISFKTDYGKIKLIKRVKNMVIVECNHVEFYYPLPPGDDEQYSSDPITYLVSNLNNF